MSTYDNTLNITRRPGSQVSAAHGIPKESFVMIRCRHDHGGSYVCQHIFTIKLAHTTSHYVRTVKAYECSYTVETVDTKVDLTNSGFTPGNNKHNIPNKPLRLVCQPFAFCYNEFPKDYMVVIWFTDVINFSLPTIFSVLLFKSKTNVECVKNNSFFIFLNLLNNFNDDLN